MSAIAAVDVALWDIKGKALNTPVYNLLGGQSRQGCLVYTHANGADIAEALDSVRKHMDEGYLAVRAQAGVPGVACSYGVPKAGKPYEPAERGLALRVPLVIRTLPQLRPASSSKNSASNSAPTSISSTTSTTASLQSKPRASAKPSSPTISSGSKTPARPNYKPALSSSANTPQHPSP